MLMTEEQAKEKWCPHIRADNVTPAWHGKRQEPGRTPQANATCIGSTCMAWRWADPEEPAERLELGTMNKKPDGDGWVCELPDAGREGYMIKSVWTRTHARRGYCGLAGAPKS